MKPVVVQVVQELAPPGGIQVMVLELQRFLSEKYAVHVVSLERSAEGIAAIWSRAAAIRNVLHGLDKPPGKDPGTVVRLARLLRELQPVAVHTHHIGPLLYGGLAARLAGVRRLIHTEHDVWHLQSRRRVMLERVALAWLRPYLVADAEVVAAALRRVFPMSAPRVVPNGIDTELFSPGDRILARRALGLPVGPTVIGSAGRLEHVKGHDVLVDAMALLPPTAMAVIAGEGSESAALRNRAARLGLQDRVVFLGQVDDMATFYRALDVFCLPSRQEGLPLCVLEAQACRIPVVATDVGGVAEALAPGVSSAVPSEDHAALGAALRDLIDGGDPPDPRGFVVARYDIRRMAQEYAALMAA